MATTETISVLVKEICNEKFPNLVIDEILPFYNNPDYIKVLGDNIKNYLEDKEWDKILLFSIMVFLKDI